jgi:hypothetical protein
MSSSLPASFRRTLEVGFYTRVTLHGVATYGIGLCLEVHGATNHHQYHSIETFHEVPPLGI